MHIRVIRPTLVLCIILCMSLQYLRPTTPSVNMPNQPSVNMSTMPTMPSVNMPNQPSVNMPEQPSKQCESHIHRPHKTHSICEQLIKGEPAAVECPVHCPSKDALQRLCGISIHESMENYGSCVQGDSENICMSVNSKSDVYLQYFSWSEIDFFRAYLKGDRDEGILVSFVSNCVQWRLDYLTELTAHLQLLGQTVHNYGACAHNADIPASSEDKYANKKIHSLKHKFLFSFENSETEGYVTEKLFYALSDGAIPVYRGASDVHLYLPSPNAAIVVSPDTPPATLAKILVDEAQNTTAYQSRLAWKTAPKPDLMWVAQMDLSILHSHCRACQRIVDMESPLDHPQIRIRERGFAEWYSLPQTFISFTQLCRNISRTLSGDMHNKPRGAGTLVSMYNLWDRNRCPIASVEEFNVLPEGSQVEVVMENPGWLLRGLS